MSVASRLSDARGRWRGTRRLWRRALERRVALDRWYPQLPIALATAPVGLLLIAGAVQTALGAGTVFPELAELERRANMLGHTPIVEAAIGISLIAISIGLALRSRLAWFWSIAAVVTGIAIRLPPKPSERAFTAYLGGILLALLLYRKRFRSHSLVGASVFASTVLLTFLMWATLGVLRLGAHFAPPIRDLATAAYFTVITVSSVGFGDIVASDAEARLFTSLMVILGILVFATAFSTILLPLMEGRLRAALGGKPYVDRSNHYVIVGKSPLARNTATQLESRRQRVTLVVDRAPEEDFYKQRDVVVGDPTDLSVLRSAGADKARGVLALSTDDAENGFVVLGVNEINAVIPTVAALNDPKNESRLKRTQPSLLLSLQTLGSELLAMALTGERIDMQMLSRVLQLHTPDAKPPK